jgi:hypothetical protein
LALWAAHCHAVEAFSVTPYVVITAPTTESAKTLTLEVLAQLVPNPWLVVQPSDAVMFRKVQSSVTVLIDEGDTIFGGRGRPTLRAILDAGNRRGAVVPRVVRGAVVDYPVFGAKALAGIGEPPDTIGSRSILIRLKRKVPRERVERFSADVATKEAGPVRRQSHRLGRGFLHAGEIALGRGETHGT